MRNCVNLRQAVINQPPRLDTCYQVVQLSDKLARALPAFEMETGEGEA